MIIDYINNFNRILNSLIVTENKKVTKTQKAIDSILERFLNIKTNTNTIYLIGNGGSNGVISHASVDLVNTCRIKAVPISESGLITCFANDYGYENVFNKPLEIYLSKSDCLIAVSSSGASKNIINSAKTAKEKGSFIITFTGFNPQNSLRNIGDYNFWLNSSDYGMVEIGHALLIHYLSDEFSRKHL